MVLHFASFIHFTFHLLCSRPDWFILATAAWERNQIGPQIKFADLCHNNFLRITLFLLGWRCWWMLLLEEQEKWGRECRVDYSRSMHKCLKPKLLLPTGRSAYATRRALRSAAHIAGRVYLQDMQISGTWEIPNSESERKKKNNVSKRKMNGENISAIKR